MWYLLVVVWAFHSLLVGVHHIGANFHGVYMSQIKNLAAIHDFIFAYGPVPTMYVY